MSPSLSRGVRALAPLPRLLAGVALLWAGLAAPASAAAPSCTDADNLLPVDQAFELSAQATAPDRIELRWKIAPSCYLYRHQLKVQADAGFDKARLVLAGGIAGQEPQCGGGFLKHLIDCALLRIDQRDKF